jgi:hypothetical protein
VANAAGSASKLNVNEARHSAEQFLTEYGSILGRTRKTFDALDSAQVLMHI